MTTFTPISKDKQYICSCLSLQKVNNFRVTHTERRVWEGEGPIKM